MTGPSISAALAALGLAAVATPGVAQRAPHHSWARTANAVRAQIGDHSGPMWRGAVKAAVADWNASAVIDSPIVPRSRSSDCKPVVGSIQMCSGAFGRSGWLATSTIFVAEGRITQAVVRLNDSYFAHPLYSAPEWRNLVTCRGLGHAYGLGRSDGPDGSGSCMDGALSPRTYQRPGARVYDELAGLYARADPAASAVLRWNGAGAFADVSPAMADWGRAVAIDASGRADRFERVDGPGLKTITQVLWAPGSGPRR